MSIHAAMIDRMDHEIGRVLDQVKAMGAYENTLVMFASDNGASAEFLNRGDKARSIGGARFGRELSLSWPRLVNSGPIHLSGCTSRGFMKVAFPRP